MVKTSKLNVLTLLFFVMTVVACSTTKNLTSTEAGEQDGMTMEKAIPVKSIAAEYEWIKTNYPGAQVTSQALLSKNKKHYDLLTFETAEGKTKKVYFDITSFFGKF
jgi:uncharacterized protein YcfL